MFKKILELNTKYSKKKIHPYINIINKIIDEKQEYLNKIKEEFNSNKTHDIILYNNIEYTKSEINILKEILLKKSY